MSDLHLYMLICIHNDLRDLVQIVALIGMMFAVEGLFTRRSR
jgi:hypothetical protein